MKIPNDKILHFSAGLQIAMWSVMMCAIFYITKSTLGFAVDGTGAIMKTVMFAATMTVLAGASKEWNDKQAGGKFDTWDMVATIAGGAVVFLPMLITLLVITLQK